MINITITVVHSDGKSLNFMAKKLAQSWYAIHYYQKNLLCNKIMSNEYKTLVTKMQ